MVAEYAIYIATSIITAGISLVLAVIAFHHQDRSGTRAFAWLMLGVSGWCLFPGLGLLSKTEEAAYLFTRTAYIFFAAVPVLWIRFSYQYRKRQLAENSRLFILLSIGPLISLFLVWTNNWHHWFWRELEFFWVNGVPTWKVVFGPGFWFHAIYSYSLILLGALIIIRYSITTFSVYRTQTIALLTGCLFPVLTSLPAVLNLTALPVTPFGLAITGLSYTWAVLRSGLLDLRPFARDLLIEQIQDGMIIVNERNKVVDINPPALKLLGGDERNVLGSSADDVLSTLMGREFHIQERIHFKSEITLVHQGQEFHNMLVLSPLLGTDQQSIGCLVHLHDITSLKKIERALRASESRSRAIISALPDSVHLIDENGCYLDSQEALEDHLPGNSTQTQTSIFDAFPMPLAEKMLQAIRTTIQSETCQSFTYEVDAVDGAERWFEARIAPLVLGTGQTPQVVWIDRETTEQVQLYRRVEHLANTDSLTGLANRRHFFKLAQEIVAQHSPRQIPCAFILIDIDHYKEVNDKYGHLTGDEVLSMVASRLVQHVRARDVVARYGGEEFAVFLPNTSQAEAEQVAQRLCRTIAAEPFALGKTIVPLSISIGMISALIDGDLQLDKLIEKADDALYAAKRAGRNTVKIHPASTGLD